jgi:hypothetical protein
MSQYSHKRNEQQRVVRLPEVKGQLGIESVAFMEHILDQAMIELNRAREVAPNVVQLPTQAMPEHLEQGPYYGEQAS